MVKEKAKTEIVNEAKVAKVAEETLALKIWNKIKDIDLELFALPDQVVSKNADPVLSISDTELHLLLKSQAALPQLEEKLDKVVWDRKDPSKKLEAYQKSKFVVVRLVSE